MANRPYQERVDEFLADYTDRFIPTLVTGKPTEKTGAGTAIPMTKEQLQLERDKILASSIHPETFNKVLDTMKGEKAIPSNIPSDQWPIYGTRLGEDPLAKLARKIIHPSYHGELGFQSPTGEGGRPIEMKINPATGVYEPFNLETASYTPQLTGFTEPGPKQERAIPSLESVWGIKREGDRFTLPGTEGTMTVGPERFFIGGKEVPAGTPGAMSGDQLARERIMAESGGAATPIPQQGWWVTSPGGGRYWETSEENARARAISEQMYGGGGFGIPTDVSKALADVQKILMTPTTPIYSPSGRQVFAGGYRPYQVGALENYAATLEKLAGAGIGYQTKMAEITAEKPYREAMADYYRRMAGVHEAAIPMETFEKYARGTAALRESERPYAFPPNSAVYQGAKLLGYVPEKPEAIHPIIRDVINKSMMIDPATGQQTGFDIRGARQKIGFMAPWLKAQGIDVPKESYKMTKSEFMAEHKAWIEKQPKKDRKKYNTQYMEQLWKEYWGD